MCLDEYPPAKSRDGGDTQLHTRASLEALTLPELVTLLTELVSLLVYCMFLCLLLWFICVASVVLTDFFVCFFFGGGEGFWQLSLPGFVVL